MKGFYLFMRHQIIYVIPISWQQQDSYSTTWFCPEGVESQGFFFTFTPRSPCDTFYFVHANLEVFAMHCDPDNLCNCMLLTPTNSLPPEMHFKMFDWPLEIWWTIPARWILNCMFQLIDWFQFEVVSIFSFQFQFDLCSSFQLVV